MMLPELATYADLARGLLAEMTSADAIDSLAKQIYSDMIGSLGFAHRHHAVKVAQEVVAAILEEA
jgi:hypothetical protein